MRDFAWPVRVYHEDTDAGALCITLITLSLWSVPVPSGCVTSVSSKIG